MTGPGAALGAGLVRRTRRWYGAHPLHLLALLAAFGLAGYAVRAVIAAGQWRGFAEWFAMAIVAHDLLLFPLYALADLSLRRLLPRWPAGARPGRPTPPPPAVLNYVRIPAAFSLLLLAVFFPLILGLSGPAYRRASGLETAPYLWRWLAITGLMFTASAACYAAAWRRAASRGRKAPGARRRPGRRRRRARAGPPAGQESTRPS